MDTMDVKYKGGIGFEAKARQHAISIDLSEEKGGQDAGMNPPEVFMASLGACIGVYVVRYCRNAKLDAEGMDIRLEWELSDDKTRISRIDAVLSLPHADIGRRDKAILDAAHRCLLHNTILGSPDIRITLKSTPAA